ncbi:ABC transporter permease [Mycobacterium sp.]|uniref:ABC transporter permease n=1 Tax=Mycobacterium sp. TaxID=1785 RepID=UPI003D0D31A4
MVHSRPSRGATGPAAAFASRTAPSRRAAGTRPAGPTRSAGQAGAAAVTLGVSDHGPGRAPAARRPTARRGHRDQRAPGTGTARRATHRSHHAGRPRWRGREFRHPLRQAHRAASDAVRQACRVGHHRPGVGQRHRDPRRAGLPVSRNADLDAAGHRDPRHQRQRHVRQRHPGRVGDPQRRRRRHRRQHRPGGQRWLAGPPQRNRGRHPHRRPGGAQRPVRRRERQTTAHRHLADRAAGDADGGDRRIRRGEEHAGPSDRRLHHPQRWLGDVRGPRHSRRVRLAAQQNRHGPAGRRRAPAADGQPGASYAAELRLPPDTSKADRTKVVAQVLGELDLTKHAHTRVDKLSGGQRKRASVALELLTGPSLLMLDEPTSGLDPALDLQVMTMLRQLADAGRVVLVVTHSLSYLDVCDQVLLVAPGGKTAYCGPPDGIGEVMGTTNWARIFSQVGADPDEANRRFRERDEPQPPSKADAPADLGEPVHTSVPRQISTIARRQVRLVVADRAYFMFLALLPFILGALSLTVPGDTGFRATGPHTGTPDEAAQILALLLPAAAFMGIALTIRDLVGERPIFQREQAVGLSTTAYLLAKTLVFCGFAILQAAIVTTIVVVGKGAPSSGAVLLGHSTVAATGELFLTVAAACVASAVLGLAISSLVRSSEQIMPLFVVAVMAQLVLCGGMVPVTGRLGLDQMSWLMPARWGYAAAASTVDLRHLVPPTLLPQDQFWQHTRHFWLLDMGMLAGLTVFYACFVRWKIRLRR